MSVHANMISDRNYRAKAALYVNLPALIAGMAIGWLAFNHYVFNIGYAVDDSYITFRYAYNFVEGFGLTFNPDERHYGSTAAGFAILVGITGKVLAAVDGVLSTAPRGLKWAIPHAAGIVSTLSLLAVALLNLKLALRIFGNKVAGPLVAVFAAVVLFGARDGSVVSGHETYTYLALCYAAAYLMMFTRHAMPAAVALLAAIMVRPDAMLFGAILFSIALVKRWVAGDFRVAVRGLLMPALFVAIGTFAWLSLMAFYYGHPLPETKVAKQAQIILGYWPAFSAKTVWGQATASLLWPMPWLVIAGAAGLACYGSYAYVIGRWDEDEVGLFSMAIIWSAFAVSLVTAYEAMRVTYWLWYGVPFWFCFVVLTVPSVWAVSRIVAIALHGKERSATASARTFMAIGLVALVILHDGGFVRHHVQRLVSGANVNQHIGSYEGAIAFIRERHPGGTTLALAEPGHVGFSLGPAFKVVDLLGLTSPGVARAIIANDLDFPIRQWRPRYVIASWQGNYNPDSRPEFFSSYRLVKTFEHPYWQGNLGGPYKLYERSN